MPPHNKVFYRVRARLINALAEPKHSKFEKKTDAYFPVIFLVNIENFKN